MASRRTTRLVWGVAVLAVGGWGCSEPDTGSTSAYVGGGGAPGCAGSACAAGGQVSGAGGSSFEAVGSGGQVVTGGGGVGSGGSGSGGSAAAADAGDGGQVDAGSGGSMTGPGEITPCPAPYACVADPLLGALLYCAEDGPLPIPPSCTTDAECVAAGLPDATCISEAETGLSGCLQSCE